MNRQTCPDRFCGATLRNGKCVACGLAYQDVKITLTDANGRALDLGVAWPVVVSADAASVLRDALEAHKAATGYVMPPICVVEIGASEKAEDAFNNADNLMDIYGKRWEMMSVSFKETIPGRYTYPEPKRKKRW